MGGKAPEDRRSDEYAADNLADHARLADFECKPAAAHRDQQDDGHLGQQQGHIPVYRPDSPAVLPYRDPDDKLLSLERLSAFETLLFLSFHLVPGIRRNRGFRARGNPRRPSARGVRTLSRQ